MSFFTKMISAAMAICLIAGAGATTATRVLAEGEDETVIGITEENPAETTNAITPIKGLDVVNDSGEDVYRLYNPNSGEHLYTADYGEMGYLRTVGWRYEGVAFRALIHSSIPVYRMYNPVSGDHHFTASAAERDMLVRAGWRNEGIAFYGASEYNVPQYRLYNPNAVTGSHFYTSSAAERDMLIRAGWRNEGVGFYTIR